MACDEPQVPHAIKTLIRSILLAVHPGLLLINVLIGPGHARGVMGDSDAALLVQQDHAAVPIETRFEISNGFIAGRLRGAAFANTISRALGQHQFHDWLTPASARGSGALVIGVAAAADKG